MAAALRPLRRSRRGPSGRWRARWLSRPGPFARLSAVEPSSPARSSIPDSSQSSTTGRPSRTSRFHGWMSLWVSTTGPGRSQVSTKWAIARNVSTWEASSSAHGCPVAVARSASSGQSREVGPSFGTWVHSTSSAWMRARISPTSNPYAADTGASGTFSPSTHRCTSVCRPAEIGSGIGMPAAKAARSNLNTSSTW